MKKIESIGIALKTTTTASTPPPAIKSSVKNEKCHQNRQSRMKNRAKRVIFGGEKDMLLIDPFLFNQLFLL